MVIRFLTITCFIACIGITACAQVPARYDIVIDELLADPSPAIGLPNAEFIELKNISSAAYDLHGWKISNHSSAAIIKTNFILQPDSFLLICSSSAVAAYSTFGSTIGIPGFPSLDNNEDIISLQSPEGITIHAVAYDKSSYQNEIKSSGGWSLEMIDTKNPCNNYNNWKASADSRGGTPGKINSVDGINKDQQSPSLLRTYAADSTTIIAVFDEPLDSNSASLAANYLVDQGIGIPIAANAIRPLFNEVQLNFPAKLKAKTVYQLIVNNVTDCSGNGIGTKSTAKTGLPDVADTMDIVVNEILFNPQTTGYDYVELYNRSNKIIDMKQLYAANRTATGTINNTVQMSPLSLLFFPGEYFVITENSHSVNQNYLVKDPDKILELSSLPSLPDDHGNILLLNHLGNIVDALEYDHKWHFGLIDNEEGVALERIDYNQPTQKESNWTSASSTSGFGTPAYQNSQFKTSQQVQGGITINPKIFSPDNDGYEDYCFIQYQAPDPGYVANITIFDAAGRPVRYLANNAILGLSGNFRWDGLDDHQKKLPIGIYVILTEIFNLNGYTKKFKNVVTLGRRF